MYEMWIDAYMNNAARKKYTNMKFFQIKHDIRNLETKNMHKILFFIIFLQVGSADLERN